MRGADLVDVGSLSAEFPAAGRGRREGGDDRDAAFARRAARAARSMRASVVEVEPVAGLDLDRRHALGDQRVEPRQRCGDQLVLARRARRATVERRCRRPARAISS